MMNPKILARINLAVDGLLEIEKFTMQDIIAGLKEYTRIAEIAEETGITPSAERDLQEAEE